MPSPSSCSLPMAGYCCSVELTTSTTLRTGGRTLVADTRVVGIASNMQQSVDWKKRWDSLARYDMRPVWSTVFSLDVVSSSMSTTMY